MKLDKKQKILLTLVIIALAYLAWQIYNMFFAGASQPATTHLTPAATVIAAQPQTLTTTTAAPAVSAPAITQAMSPVTQPAAAISGSSSPRPLRQVTLLPPMSAYQSEYLQLVNRYQLLKMRRLIADEEAAIASSQAKIAQLNQQSGGTVSSAPTAFPAMAAAPAASAGYQLMYIDYQDGRWSAILSHNNRFKEVYEGTVLSDGTHILKIDSNGVVTRRRGQQSLLSFYGTTPLPKSQYISAHAIFVPTKIKPVPPVFTSRMAYPRHATSNPTNRLQPIASAPTLTRASAPTAVMPSAPINPPAPVNPPATKQLTIIPETTAPITATVTVKPVVNAPIVNNPAVTAPPKTAALDLTPQQKTTVTQLENSITKTPVNADSFSADEKHLLGLPKTHFTLQILGSYKLSDLNDIVKTNHLQDAFIFHTYYLNKDWYVLISGDYTTEDEATNALKALPPAVQSLKPWVRTISSVQDAIKLTPQNG